jgi:hypothetical protein
MANKVTPVVKNRRCRCGKKVTHHHFLCDDCWNNDKTSGRAIGRAMRKNELLIESGEKKAKKEILEELNKFKIINKVNFDLDKGDVLIMKSDWDCIVKNFFGGIK